VNIAVNCSLMPGVKIGDDAFVGPNTVVEEDVPAGSRVFVDQNTVVKR
jgi:acetyltransferase-like isoleucine patch superfamily enzyme